MRKRFLILIIFLIFLSGGFYVWQKFQTNRIKPEVENEISCAREGEKVNRNPLTGPTIKKCCHGLIE